MGLEKSLEKYLTPKKQETIITEKIISTFEQSLRPNTKNKNDKLTL